VDPFIEELGEPLDKLDANAGDAEGKRAGSQEKHRAHHLARKSRPDGGCVRSHDVPLQVFCLARIDPHAGEVAETGADPVNGATGFDRLFNHSPRRPHPVVEIGRKLDPFAADGYCDDIVEGQVCSDLDGHGGTLRCRARRRGERGSMAGEKRDLDRELIELLNELRVALPGVQVLFAFLLAVPFSQRFGSVSDLQRNAYFVALLATLVSSALLIAPSAQHRLQWREKDKERLLEVSNRLAIAGIGVLALAMTTVVFLVTDVLFEGPLAAIVTAVSALVFAELWYVMPLTRKSKSQSP
jgi:hypothetical protein